MGVVIDCEANPQFPMSMDQYIETCFTKFLDQLTFNNPYLQAPYLEITDREAGVYEVVMLIHVSPKKGELTSETENVSTEHPEISASSGASG